MKWYGLAVVLAVGLLVVGCPSPRATQPQVVVPKAPTPAAALQLVDTAVADLEAALQGTNTDGMFKAAQKLGVALLSLNTQLIEKEGKEADAAHAAGKPVPASLRDRFGPAMVGSDEVCRLLAGTAPDVAKAKALLPEIKSGVDTVRDAAK